MTGDQLRAIFRDNLKLRRNELGLTQTAAAARAEIAQAYWAQMEAGNRYPGPDALAKLATALNTTPDALLSPSIFSGISG